VFRDATDERAPTVTKQVITARNLTVTYRTPGGFTLPGRDRDDAVQALRGVSFDVGRGEAFGVIGRNGAGKSTLLRVLAGTLVPDEGSLEVKGRTSTLLALGVGFNPDLSGRRNIILGSLAAGLSRKEAERIAPDVEEYAELGATINRPLSTYSRGQQSRLAFAIARNLDPDVLLIDEVLAVGDEAFRQKTLADMRQLLTRSGTIVFVSHALGIVREFCDRVLWLDEGTTMQIGEPRQVVEAYRRRFVKPEFELVRDVTAGRSGVPAEVIRVDREPPPDVSIPALRSARADTDPREYVDPNPLLIPRRAARRGRRALANGWKDADKQRLPFEPPILWDRHDDRGVHAWDPVGLLLVAYGRDRYERMLQPALDYAVDWIRAHTPDPLGGGVWAADVVGRRAVRLAALLDLALRVDGVADAAIEQLVASAVDHAAALEDPARFDPSTDDAIWQVAGMNSLAAALPEVEATEKLHGAASERLEDVISTQFTGDGVHRRHSPSRHLTATAALGAALGTGLLPEDAVTKPLRKAERALEWFVTPTGYLAGFGDIAGEPISKHWTDDPPGSFGDAKRRWVTKEMRNAASRGAIGRAPDAEVRGFRNGGYFVVKTRSGVPAHLAMQCGFHSDAGKEADDLSITWHDAGRDLLVDAGRYRGEDPAFREFSMSTRAHNTIEVDGHDHHSDRPKYRSALNAAGTVDGVHYGTARVGLGGVVANRALVYVPGSWLLVFDTLEDRNGDERSYRQWFHAAPDLGVAETDGVADAEPITPVRGVLEPVAQGWHSPGSDVVIPNWAFGWRTTSRDIVRFATLLSLDGRPEHVIAQPGDDEAEFAWTIAGARIRLAIDLGREDPVSVETEST
jgi:teichoic acid transport system ATP-binding protein